MTYTPRYSNIVTLLQTAIERYPSRPLFGTRSTHGWQYITYTEFGNLVAAMRGGLAGLGLQADDKLAVISDNRVEWAVGSFATLSLGAAYVPMYQAQKDADYRFILRDAGVKLCFCATEDIARRVRALMPELPELKHVVTFDSAEYQALLEAGRKRPCRQPSSTTTPWHF